MHQAHAETKRRVYCATAGAVNTHMGGTGGANSIDQKKLIHQLLVMHQVLVVHSQRVLKDEAFCK